MNDKRRHPRVQIHVPVLLELRGQESVAGVAVDLSLGGVSIQAETVPPFGTELTLVGDFPGALALRLPAVVRWVSPGGFGAQFGLLGAREAHALTALVRGPRT